MICGNLKWRSQSDSNQRMSDLQSEALPALLYLQQKCIVQLYKSFKIEKDQMILILQWQRARDSNPRRREPRRFSKPVQSTNSVNSLHILMVRMIGIEPILPNGNWILSPTRLPVPPHSLFFRQYNSSLSLKLDWNYNSFFIFCQEFFT